MNQKMEKTTGNKNSGENIRELALEGLLLIEKEGVYVNHCIAGIFEKYSFLASRDKAFLKRLIVGVTERKISLDFVIDSVSKTPVKKMKPQIRNIIRMGVYQLLFMDVPDSAVCNEAVKLAKRKKFNTLAGFVNGVLRNIAGKKVWHLKSINENDDLSVKYSVPKWIIDKWICEFGKDKAKQSLDGLMSPKRICIRIKDGKLSDVNDNLSAKSDMTLKELVVKELEAAKIDYSNCLLDNCLYLLRADSFFDMDSFKKGYFTVSDMSSVLAVMAAGIRKNDKVVDLSAAPGGKLIYASEFAGDSGCVYGFDIAESKEERVIENLKRMNCKNVTFRIHDARMEVSELIGAADVVIADLPCSGLGVIGRKPDIRYRVSEEDIKELQKLQREILMAGMKYVKTGGTLLYSTCTVSEAENMEQVRWILENGFRQESVKTNIPENILNNPDFVTFNEGHMQIFPGMYGMDGFFMAKFIKK